MRIAREGSVVRYQCSVVGISECGFSGNGQWCVAGFTSNGVKRPVGHWQRTTDNQLLTIPLNPQSAIRNPKFFIGQFVLQDDQNDRIA